MARPFTFHRVGNSKVSVQDIKMLSRLGLNADWLYALTGSTWKGFDTQGGRVTQRSKQWPDTFRISGLVVRAKDELFVSGASVDLDDQEWFFLEVEPTRLAGPMMVLSSARPPYRLVQDWPATIALSPSLLLDEHRSIEVGVTSDAHGRANDAARLMWFAAKSGSATVFVFADAEVPLDVFLTISEETAALARTVLSTRATAAGFACRRVVFGGHCWE